MDDNCEHCAHDWHGLRCAVEWFDWTGQHRCECPTAWRGELAPAALGTVAPLDRDGWSDRDEDAA